MNAYAATPEAFPALVLNADFRPLSYYQPKVSSWQESVKAVFLDRVNISFAALQMNQDLGFSPQAYGFGAGIFF